MESPVAAQLLPSRPRAHNQCNFRRLVRSAGPQRARLFRAGKQQPHASADGGARMLPISQRRLNQPH